jgi:hypothetical protein
MIPEMSQIWKKIPKSENLAYEKCRKNKSRTFFDGYSRIVDKAQGNLMSFVLCQFGSFLTPFGPILHCSSGRNDDYRIILRVK